ncbi:MAG: polysaccharide deacetylase family protein [Clostridia bacterium]|nr:polysaccharide deacetylase family protein [Clostridia bacterium]
MRSRYVKLLSCVLTVSLLAASVLAGVTMPIAAEGETTQIIFGGDFEAAADDAVYNTNWTGDVLTGSDPCTIVEDTSGASEGNHCLKVPVTSSTYNKYLKGLTLQPNTSYTLSFDARGGQVWVYVGGYGVTDAPGVVWVGGTEEWKRYSVTFNTGDNADGALSSFVDWGISISRNPSYAVTVESESYLDNFKLEVTPAAESGIVTGGSFEAPEDSAVYTANWGTILSQGAKLVLDPLDGSNRCLMFPKVETNTDFYLKKLYLEDSTTYRFTLDVYSPSQALMYLWGNAFTEGGAGRVIPANTAWTTITFELTTAADLSSNVALPDWIWSFARKTTEPYNDSPLYIDNVSIVKVEEEVPEEPEEPVEPDMSVENADNYVRGGSFEYAADDAIYNTNFSMLSSLSIVTDPKDTNHHCLFSPQSVAKDYYFTNLLLEPLTTYVFEFDILNTGTAGVYFWGSEVFQNNGGSHSIAGSTEWQHVKYEMTTTEGIRNEVAYPNYLFAFMKSYEPYNQSDMYIDNVSITVKQKEVPSVKPIVTGGDFEDTGALNTNWSTALNKGSVVEDTLRDGNHCLKLPMADSPIGDVYVSSVWLEPNTSYFVTFDMRGGASRVYFYGNALLENGAQSLAESDEWRSYAYKVTTVSDDTYLKGGYQNYIIGFNKNDAATNTADTFIDNFRVVKAGAYVDPELENGSMTLSSWKDPDTVGAQASPAAGGTVTVTVTPNEGYMLKPGSLYYVTEDGTKQQILNKESGAFGEGAGDTFRFILPEGSVVVTAEFVPTAAQNFRFETLGTSVYYEKNTTDPSGLRFLNRLYVDGLNVEDDTLTVTYGGKTYTVVEFGSLLKRTTNEAALTLENVDDTATSATRVWKAAAYVDGVMKLVDYTDSYVDFTVIMKTANANAAFAAREYTACGYMLLSDGTSTVTLYSKSMTDSAASTAARVQFMADKDDDWRLHPQDFKLIATTFDRPDFTDGTGRMETIIEALVALDGSATLNVAGESLAEGHAKRESQIALLTDAISKGFEIGSYTWGNDTWGYSKAELDARTEEELIKYISDTQTVVQEALGVTPEYLRPPLLLSNDTVRKVCKQLGLSLVTGNSSWRDFPSGYTLEESGGVTFESLTNYARDGAIWIVHAHNGDAPTEYPRAIQYLYEQGYRFCTVAELMEYNGQTREAGQTYKEVIPVY